MFAMKKSATFLEVTDFFVILWAKMQCRRHFSCRHRKMCRLRNDQLHLFLFYKPHIVYKFAICHLAFELDSSSLILHGINTI